LKRFLLWLWRVLPMTRGTRFAALWRLNLGVIGVVVDDAGRVLLLKHSYRNEFPWGLPAGWARRGEQPEETIVRELQEEVGLRVRVVSVLDARIDRTLPRTDLPLLCRPVDHPGLGRAAPPTRYRDTRGRLLPARRVPGGPHRRPRGGAAAGFGGAGV